MKDDVVRFPDFDNTLLDGERIAATRQPAVNFTIACIGDPVERADSDLCPLIKRPADEASIAKEKS